MLKKYIIAFLVSMIPLIELRGGVPIGTGMVSRGTGVSLSA